MAIKLNPYLNFQNETRQAMEFYKSVFGGDLKLQTFKDFGASQDQSDDNLVMHSVLETANGMTIMSADTPKHMEHRPGANVNLSIGGEASDDVALTGYFEKLSAGGTIMMPLEKAMWGDKFGMCTDKFGVNWLINIAASKE